MMSLRRQTNRSKQLGTTLLEILVALAFFSITAIAILDTVGTTSRTVNSLEKQTIAHWVASNYIELSRSRSDWPNVGVQRAETDMAGRTWYITSRVQATARKDIRRLIVEVSDDPDGEILSSRDWFFGRVQ